MIGVICDSSGLEGNLFKFVGDSIHVTPCGQSAHSGGRGNTMMCTVLYSYVHAGYMVGLWWV